MTHKINQLKNTKMKFLLLFFLMTIGTTYAQNANSNKEAGIMTFESSDIDYGSINQYDNGERLFTFKNTGNAPIVITQVRSSCGCTVPSYSKEPIMPGQSSEIQVKYATNRLGVFKKTITVLSNAEEPAKILYIKGNVLSPAK